MRKCDLIYTCCCILRKYLRLCDVRFINSHTENYGKSYDKLKIDRRVLSRNAEVGGTMTSGMVPWSDNGIYMAGILGVSTFSYLPFMWLSFVAIGLAIIYGYTGNSFGT